MCESPVSSENSENQQVWESKTFQQHLQEQLADYRTRELQTKTALEVTPAVLLAMTRKEAQAIGLHF